MASGGGLYTPEGLAAEAKSGRIIAVGKTFAFELTNFFNGYPNFVELERTPDKNFYYWCKDGDKKDSVKFTSYKTFLIAISNDNPDFWKKIVVRLVVDGGCWG
jgi:hypothetical protein